MEKKILNKKSIMDSLDKTFGPKTKVVNLRIEDSDTYIGRKGYGEDGYFGNPFQLKDYKTRQECLEAYKKYFYDRIEWDPEFKRRVLDLRGKKLGCFCKPFLCHGDIIVEYLNNQ